MLVVLVAFFQMLGMTAMTEPLNKMLDQIFTYLPKLLSATVLLLVAWIAGSLLRRVVTGVLSRANIERRLAEPAGLETATGSTLLQRLGIAEVTVAEERSPSIAEATSAEDRPPATTEATFALNRPPSQVQQPSPRRWRSAWEGAIWPKNIWSNGQRI